MDRRNFFKFAGAVGATMAAGRAKAQGHGGPGTTDGAEKPEFVGVLVEPIGPILSLIAQLLAFAAVLSFFVGFAPPAWIRRAWREPDLRRFLDR